jgi:hypothetical protein
VGEPVQVPVVAVNVFPTFVIPEILGGVFAIGAAGGGGAGTAPDARRIAAVIGARETDDTVDPSAAMNGAPSDTLCVTVVDGFTTTVPPE